MNTVFRSGDLNSGWFLYPYKSPVKDLLTGLKFLKKRHLTNAFNDDIGDIMTLIRSENRYDWIVPIPLDRGRKLERHFNQAELIARRARKSLNLPLRSCLKKKHSTMRQSTFSKEERIWNIRNSFKVARADSIQGKSILLVDDIYTTGATASEAARTLKECGASRIDIFAVARTQTELRKQVN
ncbi:MAG: ComF family protein [Candidatus Omnitrophica bacterium]|nr:ComF family protein [Candidatus Omnitrophota bacterium]